MPDAAGSASPRSRPNGDFSQESTPIVVSFLPDATTVGIFARGFGREETLAPYVREVAGTRFGDTFFISRGRGEWTIDGAAGPDAMRLGLVGYRYAEITGSPNGPFAVPADPEAGSRAAAAPGKVAFDGTAVRLGNVERLHFVDGVLSFETVGARAQIHRLYHAAYDQFPDVDSTVFDHWMHNLERGAPLRSLAADFMRASPGFDARFPAAAGPDDAAFVEQLYRNVLDRPSDAAGKEYWARALAARAADRADLLAAFSDSPENAAAWDAGADTGVWIGSGPAAEAARLYHTVLGRLADANGLLHWAGARGPTLWGAPLGQIADTFIASAEFEARHGALADGEFVAALYGNAFGRRLDDADLAAWTDALSRGVPRGEVAARISESAEHVALTAPWIDNGIWLA